MTERTQGLSRRGLLRRGGGVAAGAAVLSASGCLSLLPPVGQEIRYGRVDVPAAVDSDPVYRRWIPAQNEVPDVERDIDVADLNWVSVTPGNLGQDELGAAFTIGAAIAQSGLDYVGHGYGRFEHVHGLGSLGVVAEADLDLTQVTETILDGGYERDGTYNGWDLFDRTDRPRAIALSPSAVVQTGGADRRALLEVLCDAGDGRVARRHERDKAFERYTDWVGTYPSFVEGFGTSLTETSPQEGGMAYTFDEEAAYYSWLLQYADGEAPSKTAIKRALEDDYERATRAMEVDIERDPPRVAVQLRLDAAEVRNFGTNDRLPHVMWGFEKTEETVTIRHEAGDPIPMERLDMQPEASFVDPPSSGEKLEPGDELTVARSELPEQSDTISLVYNYAGSSHDTAVLVHVSPDDITN